MAATCLLLALAPQVGITFTDRALPTDIDLGTPRSGVAVIDHDGDGWQDLVFGDTPGNPIRLYRNAPDPAVSGARTYVEVLGSGLDDAEGTERDTRGLLVADYDGDGLQDVFAVGWRSADDSAGILYRNLGGGLFQNTTASAGLRLPGCTGEAAGWNDFDLDGDVDLLVACRPGAGGNFRLLENQGDGTFANVTSKLAATPSFIVPYSLTWTDYDGDGWDDAFVLVEGGPQNIVFHNVPDGAGGRRFDNAGPAIGFGPLGGLPMGIAMGDYDGDGDLDVAVTNSGSGAYFENQGGTLLKVAPFATVWGWGNAWLDGENDGDLDYFNAASWPASSTNRFFRNDGGTFVNWHGALGGVALPSRHSVALDWQNDGLVDLVVVNPSGAGTRPHLYENGTPATNRWLRVRLTGDGARVNTLAIGALVRVRAGGATWVRQVQSGSSTTATEDLRLHFGLGSVASVDSIEVVWPRAGELASRTEVFDGPFAVDAQVDLSPQWFAPYCTAKVNSCGALPRIGSQGLPSATAASGFVVSCEGARAGKPGLWIYTDQGAGSAPFQGGTLCVAASGIRRSVALFDAVGTSGMCDGALSIDVNAFGRGSLGGHPHASLSTPGAVVHSQFWGRDTLANGSLLSDGLAFYVGL